MGLMIIAIAAAIIILLLLAIIFRDKNHKKDYHSFFIMGIVWVGAGIPLMVSTNSPALFITGLIFMGVGLIHKKEWEQNRKDKKNRWKKLSKKDKKKYLLFKWITFFILLLGLIILGVVYSLAV